jgi:hypothetical protein
MLFHGVIAKNSGQKARSAGNLVHRSPGPDLRSRPLLAQHSVESALSAC